MLGGSQNYACSMTVGCAWLIGNRRLVDRGPAVAPIGPIVCDVQSAERICGAIHGAENAENTQL
jgi:hypothetical protein